MRMEREFNFLRGTYGSPGRPLPFSREPTVPLDEPSLFSGGQTNPFLLWFLIGCGNPSIP